jgi:hypothetical protein
MVVSGSVYPRLPTIAQFAQFQKDGFRVGLIRQIGKGLAQAGDDGWALQPEKAVDLALARQGADKGLIQILAADRVQQMLRILVAGFPVKGEAQIVLDVIVAWV